MKFLFVATVLVFSIGSETAARLLVNETRDTPLELLLDLHVFYDLKFDGIAFKAPKDFIQEITDEIKDIFKLPSFPSEIILNVVGITRLEDKDQGRRNLSKKLEDFKDVLRKGNYPETTHLFLLLTFDSEGRSKVTRQEVSKGSRVCSGLNEDKALIFEYWGETSKKAAMFISQLIGHALYIQYDGIDSWIEQGGGVLHHVHQRRKDDQGQDCERGLMTPTRPKTVWSSCSYDDFTKKFNGPVGLPCLKSPEFNVKIHVVYDWEFKNRFNETKIRSLVQKAKTAFKLNSLTPKINLEFHGYTLLRHSFDIDEQNDVRVSGNKNFEEFKLLIKTSGNFSDTSDLFMLISAYPEGKRLIGGMKEPKGIVCAKAKEDRAFVIKHNDDDEFTSYNILQMIAHALHISKDKFIETRPARTDKNGQPCNDGYMAVYRGIDNQDVDRWSQCSVDDLAAYIKRLNSGCGFCLKKPFDWSADAY